ncbi:MAG: carboxynorspermidine decarboxylase [Methanobacteriota archaeon]|nr:MAG: carboxynorspermidine decarboxylase [Euryarchaeota archaeon]
MQRKNRFDESEFAEVPSPCYVIDELAIEENCRILGNVQELTGCKILMALKGFTVPDLFPLISRYLQGTCASGLYEARLGKERFGKEVHVYAPAYDDFEFEEILKISDHIVFNSIPQWNRYRPLVEKNPTRMSCGIRINPEYSEIPVGLWDPCARYSRFGVRADDMRSVPEGIEGLHFHALCQQNSDSLERLVDVVEEKFGPHLSQVKWVNIGGGQLVTAPDYDIDRLCRVISDFREEHGVDVYMEPGEAVAFNAGVLLATVLDIVHNEMDIAILDASAWAHIQDVLATSYKLEVVGGEEPGRLEHTYRLASRSCLSGDILGDYSFEEPLRRGSKIMFSDLASYSVVSNNMFNGIPLPAIVIYTRSNVPKIVRRSRYEDYESRLL